MSAAAQIGLLSTIDLLGTSPRKSSKLPYLERELFYTAHPAQWVSFRERWWVNSCERQRISVVCPGRQSLKALGFRDVADCGPDSRSLAMVLATDADFQDGCVPVGGGGGRTVKSLFTTSARDRCYCKHTSSRRFHSPVWVNPALEPWKILAEQMPKEWLEYCRTLLAAVCPNDTTRRSRHSTDSSRSTALAQRGPSRCLASRRFGAFMSFSAWRSSSRLDPLCSASTRQRTSWKLFNRASASRGAGLCA